MSSRTWRSVWLANMPTSARLSLLLFVLTEFKHKAKTSQITEVCFINLFIGVIGKQLQSSGHFPNRCLGLSDRFQLNRQETRKFHGLEKRGNLSNFLEEKFTSVIFIWKFVDSTSVKDCFFFRNTCSIPCVQELRKPLRTRSVVQKSGDVPVHSRPTVFHELCPSLVRTRCLRQRKPASYRSTQSFILSRVWHNTKLQRFSKCLQLPERYRICSNRALQGLGVRSQQR